MYEASLLLSEENVNCPKFPILPSFPVAPKYPYFCVLYRKQFQSHGTREKLNPDELRDLRSARKDGRLHEALLDKYIYFCRFEISPLMSNFSSGKPLKTSTKGPANI